MTARPYTIEVVRGEDTPHCLDFRWFWRMRGPNGRVVANSSEGYATSSSARRAANAVAKAGIVVQGASK